ncbi:hypothetical protein KEM56_001040 [Ascosphaera pollenicola]|nr:hypothetical protein KEM56_001040 [Ascosphaera pollenicola]
MVSFSSAGVLRIARRRRRWLVVATVFAFFWLSWRRLLPAAAVPAHAQCRCFPGDECWPSTLEWELFNRSIEGRLVATELLATPCHDPNYDAAECDALRNAWRKPETHLESSSSFMAPWFSNGTCDPFSPQAKPCTLGNHVSYAVDVSKPTHISKTLGFAKKNNIRVVVRNTGHDYNGKSTGAGSIAIWTHHLKDLQVQEYSNRFYSGPVMKLGAGVQAWEAYKLANETDLMIVGGECPTVGLAGGYSTGGGHSALSSKFGLAADQIVSLEVVDASGEIQVANPYHNADLFWALCGGGGGTFGVVWSMTVRARLAMGGVSGANLTFTNQDISQDVFFNAIEQYHKVLPSLVDLGATAVYFFTNSSFTISPITGPGISAGDIEKALLPFTTHLSKAGIKYTAEFHEFANFYDQFTAMMHDIPVGIAQYGSWLIPRKKAVGKTTALIDICRHITDNGGLLIGVGLDVFPSAVGKVDNAVLPAWRDALVHLVVTTPWSFEASRSDMAALHAKTTNDFIPKLKAFAPSSGAYMNEADFNQPDFQKALYGKNYERLRSIKQKYDPGNIFWASNAVGSEGWEQREDGRLCPTGRS